MTRFITTMRDRADLVTGILGEMVGYIEEKDDLTKDFADVLHRLFPGEGHHLLILGDWNHFPSVESKVTEWLAGRIFQGEDLQPTQWGTIPDESGRVRVHATHMLDDYWKVSAFDSVHLEPEEDASEYASGASDEEPGKAVARIVGSGNRVPRVGPGSARLS